MGQLEKYGLYVLCLVIFLILGVTLWGGGDTPAPSRKQDAQTSIRAANPGNSPAPAPIATPPANATPPLNPANSSGLVDMDELLQPASNKNDPKKAAVVDPAKSPEKTGEAPKTVDAPAATKATTYKVQQGDTFESIARAKLGDAKRHVEIAKLNPAVKPKAMRVGQDLVLPGAKAEVAKTDGGKAVEATVDVKSKDAVTKEAVTKEATAKAVAPKDGKSADADRSYVVGKGDTFGRIAQTQLGSSKRIDEIRELNPNVDPTRLRIGQRLKLPKK